ncbi:MAG TPA: hypothetical protein DEA97_03910 [Bacteroidales bacterium]|nr:MAG: hypothetical protein UR43_C0016G0011 [candidate division TM6 bacterium GW2011_GWF2_33_332]HBS85675.1 hypothetical protein [Bacteroidales bacterium]
MSFKKDLNKTGICFFCKESKSQFNIEHFFPETIGGSFTNEICLECNKTLNKRIDQPFLSNEYIGFQRIVNKLAKQSNRKIPNPLKNIKRKVGDEEFTYSVNQDGSIERRLCQKTEYLKDGNFENGIKVCLDFKDIEKVDLIKERIAKKYCIKPSEIIEGERIINNLAEEEFQIEFSINPIIYEFVKIIVEFALKFCPEFSNSSISKKYTDFLLGKIPIDKELYNNINHNNQLMIYLNRSIVDHFYGDLKTSHAVFITPVLGYGLVGIIKIFDFVHAIVLSNDIKTTSLPYYFFINNFKTKKKSGYYLKNFSNASITIDSNFINSYIIKDKIIDSVVNNGLFPLIFNSFGSTICENIFEIPKYYAPFRTTGNYFEKLDFYYEKPFSQFFIKRKDNDQLIPIQQIKFEALIDIMT